MKNLFKVFFLVVCFLISTAQFTKADDPRAFNVMPNAYSGTAGTGTFTGPLVNAQRTYQLLINSNQLTALIGNNITALTWRIPANATGAWPTADVTFTNYDIYLAESVAPSQRRLTFDSNIVGSKIQVRSGSLLIPANAYPFGGNPNNFGAEITFNNPYTYNGGHLLIEIRHTGFTGTSRTNDALLTSTSGYGTNFSACWQNNYTGTGGPSGNQGNFCIVQLTDAPLPVEISSFNAFTNRNNVSLNWTTVMEINNMGFDIERKSVIHEQEAQWTKIGNVHGHGNSNEQNNYTFIDNGLLSGAYTYRLKQIDYNGNYEYFTLNSEVQVGIPDQFALSQNYPNPFNPVTKINYDISFDSKVSLRVYDMLGREAANLINNDLQKAGYYSVQLNGNNLTSGTYFYRIIAAGVNGKEFALTKKMILIK